MYVSTLLDTTMSSRSSKPVRGLVAALLSAGLVLAAGAIGNLATFAAGGNYDYRQLLC